MKKWSGLLALYWLFLWLYACWSYLLTDRNLILSTVNVYWQTQQQVWRWALEYPWLPAVGYGVCVVLMWLVYFKLLHKSSQTTTPVSLSAGLLLGYILFLVPLLLSYNALSHDVFNYIFNARMVVEYGADPHVKTALEFPADTWIRFMHNTHTPAPYGYGWTVISVIPYILGMKKFLVTWLLFRFFSVLGLTFMAVCFWYFHQVLLKEKPTWLSIFLVFLNPLILIEVVSNSHNDFWMMAPAILSVLLAAHCGWQKQLEPKKLFASIVLLLLSISIKLATLTLIPVWFGLVSYRWWYPLVTKGAKQLSITLPATLSVAQLVQYSSIVSTIFLWVPLTTLRSQQFHPWYWIWIGSWIWLIHSKRTTWLSVLVLCFGISSQLRYLPWLWYGNYSDEILVWQKIITWFVPVLLFVCWWLAVRKKQYEK